MVGDPQNTTPIQRRSLTSRLLREIVVQVCGATLLYKVIRDRVA